MDPNQNPNQVPQPAPPPQQTQPYPPQQPTQPYPTQPAQGYQPIVEKTNNGLAIAGLIFAFLAPFIGFILSIIALNKAKNLGGSGQGMAIAGIIISVLVFIFVSIPLTIATIASLQREAKLDQIQQQNNTQLTAPQDTVN